YTLKLDTNLPAATPGQYRIIIRTDIFHEIPETDYLNNTTASANPLNVSVPALHLGVPVSTTLDNAQLQLYQLNVTLGQTLRVVVISSTANPANEIFLRYNAVSSGVSYDAPYQGALQANQFAVIPSTLAGTYCVLVRGQAEPAAATPVTIVANVL